MLIPAWQIVLKNQILQGLACVAKYDGKQPSLTCATSAGKIMIHNPRDHNPDGTPNIKYLNINKRVTALAKGPMNPEKVIDHLLVGTQTNLMVYDVENNSDLFYKDVPDGVSSMVYGKLPGIEAPLAIVGGNCSIQGFDLEGNERFWTVTGDTVSSIALCDPDNDGQMELLVGSEDFEIRIFHLEEVMCECTETEKIVGLAALKNFQYGYALANGTVGVYDRNKRVWRIKNKYSVTTIDCFDLDADGMPELISGWSNGRFEVRKDSNGDLIYKDTFPEPISKILHDDYRMDGRLTLIACAFDGEVRAYLAAEGELMGESLDAKNETATLRDLMNQKQTLLTQLKALEGNKETIKKGESSAGAIPLDTNVSFRTGVSEELASVVLYLETNNDTIIKAANVFSFDGGVFEGESLVAFPPNPTKDLVIPIVPPRDIQADLHIQAMVGARGSSATFQVFEQKLRLPKFSLFTKCDDSRLTLPVSTVSFHISERANRLAIWVDQAFPVDNVKSAKKELKVVFRHLKTGIILCIEMNIGGDVVIRCDDMDVAADVIQDLCAYMQVDQLESAAYFPVAMNQFKEVLTKVDEYSLIRLKLTAEMADNSNLIKALVIKAEDARIIGDMKLMKRIYSDLYSLNNELIGEYTKRSNNHNELLNALKEVNQMIQRAARLRVGNAKTRVVTLCRNAVKENNVQTLFQIIETGNIRNLGL